MKGKNAIIRVLKAIQEKSEINKLIKKIKMDNNEMMEKNSNRETLIKQMEALYLESDEYFEVKEIKLLTFDE